MTIMMMIMNGECYDDCNVAAKITAGKEHKFNVDAVSGSCRL